MNEITVTEPVTGSARGHWQRIVLCLAAWGGGVTVMAWILAREPSPQLMFGVFGQKRFLALVLGAYALGWALYIPLLAVSVKEGLAHFALTSGTFVILLGAIELTAALGLVDFGRWLGGGNVPVGWGSLNPQWWRLDPELIHTRHPHQRISGQTSGDIRAVPDSAKHVYWISAQYDANGFRNSSDLDRAPVVLIGDSFVEAGLVSEQETATGLLKHKLGLDVASLGLTMYGPQQELAALRRFGLPLQPHVVIWFFFEGNDLTDVVTYESRRESVYRLFQRGDDYSRRSLLSQLYRRFTIWVTPSTEPFAPSCAVPARNGMETLFFRYGGSGVTADTAALGRVQEILATAHEEAKQRGAAFLMVYVPTKFRVYREHCDESTAFFPTTWSLDDLPERMRGWTQDRGIPFLDLTPALRTLAGNGDLLYFPDDSHWTPRGNEVIVDVVLEYLDANRWIERQEPVRK